MSSDKETQTEVPPKPPYPYPPRGEGKKPYKLTEDPEYMKQYAKNTIMRNARPQSLVIIAAGLCVVLRSTATLRLFCALVIVKSPWKLKR